MRALLPLFLTGCLSATPGEAPDAGPEDADSDASAAVLDGPGAGDAGVINDGGLDASIGPDHYGHYAISWVKTGGSCAAPDVAMDRVQVGINYLRYESEACPAVDFESSGASWTAAEELTTDAGYALEGCGQTTYEAIPMQLLIFTDTGDGYEFVSTFSAERRQVSNNVPVCTIDYELTGVLEVL